MGRRRRVSAFDADPGRSIGYQIRDGARMILARLQAHLEPHAITVAQYFVLRELYRQEGVSQRELCARLGIGENTAVATLDAMEARDLVVRTRATDDRRKMRIALTARSRALRATLLGYAAAVIDDATADLTDAEIETLRTLLARINARLAAASPG